MVQITQIDLLGYVTGFADLNHNGKLDLVGLGPLVPNGTHYTKIFERENDTTYNEVYVGNDVNLDFVEWTGDSDSDGLGEILVSRPFNEGKVPTRKFFLYESRDSLSYPDTTNVIWTYIKGSYTFAPVYCEDLDQDGRKEFIFVDGDSGWLIKIFEAVGDNTYILANDSMRFSGNAEVFYLSFGDLDGDGFQEIMLGRQNGEVRVIENTGDDAYAFTWSGDTDASNSYASTYLGDSDGDGKNEFVVGGNNPGVYHLLTVFESDGDNSCTEIWETMIYNFPFGIQTLETGDIDGDGIYEFVFYNSGDSTWFYEATLNDEFECITRRAGGGTTIHLIDLNGNEKSELLASGAGLTFVFEYDSILTGVGLGDDFLVPRTIRLHQNYPNPFNSNTLIVYDLDVATRVRVTVHDIIGREVRTILDQNQTLGYHTILWSGDDSHGGALPSGTYIIRLVTPNQVKSIKGLLLR
jgi:hypothetical protein